VCVEVGTIIGGKLRVERVLGRGGMGVVVVATHLQLRQQVAVKVLRDELVTDAVTVERFLREGQACAQLRSEHVCRVFDVGTLESGAPYLVMELLAGDDLAAVIAQRPLTLPETIDVVGQACQAIGEAHALGIVHRDLKPSNLFVTRRPDGTRMIKVIDFGIAKTQVADLQLTQTATMMGSPGYMSPEQLRSARDVDARTDVWALGVILYQCVSGQMPFPATTITELVAKVLSEPPQPLRVEPRFDAIVMRCLEKDRDRRYPNVDALVRDLRALGTSQLSSTVATGPGVASNATAASVAPPAPTPSPRPRTLGIAVGACVIAAIAIAVASRRGETPGAPPATGMSTTDGTRERAFAQAMFDHRCDDARVAAAALGTPQHIEQARACTPRPVSTKVYPDTLDGANDANMAGDRKRAFEIAERLLVHDPDNPALLQLAGLLACELRLPVRARLYVPRITPADTRTFILEQCRLLGVTIP
jgi:tRNA A-37 threonylcarbamoyl transferase component Bud32